MVCYTIKAHIVSNALTWAGNISSCEEWPSRSCKIVNRAQVCLPLAMSSFQLRLIFLLFCLYLDMLATLRWVVLAKVVAPLLDCVLLLFQESSTWIWFLCYTVSAASSEMRWKSVEALVGSLESGESWRSFVLLLCVLWVWDSVLRTEDHAKPCCKSRSGHRLWSTSCWLWWPGSRDWEVELLVASKWVTNDNWEECTLGRLKACLLP